MTMCSNDRLGRFANRSSHQFKSARSRGFLPLALVTQRAAGFPARYRPCPNSPSVQSLLNAGNLGAFVAAHFLFGLSQNDPYYRVQSAPCHQCKRQEARLRHELDLAKALQGSASLEAAVSEAEAALGTAKGKTE